MQSLLAILSDPTYAALISGIAGIVVTVLHGRYPVLSWALQALATYAAQFARPATPSVPPPSPTGNPTIGDGHLLQQMLDELRIIRSGIPAPTPAK